MLAANFKAGWKGGAATSEAEINGNTSYQARWPFTRLWVFPHWPLPGQELFFGMDA